MCGSKGIVFAGFKYNSYIEVLHRDAFNCFEVIFDGICGFDYFDGRGFDSEDIDRILEDWEEIVSKLRQAVPLPFEPGDLKQVAEKAQKELEEAAKLPPLPKPFVYQITNENPDGWSQKLAQTQLEKLNAYRKGDIAVDSEEVADVLHFVSGETEDRFVSKVGGLPY